MMDRRSFLKFAGTGLVASATMAEAGMLAEFMSWLRGKPVWSFPSVPPPITLETLNGIQKFILLKRMGMPISWASVDTRFSKTKGLTVLERWMNGELDRLTVEIANKKIREKRFTPLAGGQAVTAGSIITIPDPYTWRHIT